MIIPLSACQAAPEIVCPVLVPIQDDMDRLERG